MQKFSQKYAIVALLEAKKEGHAYSSDSWPLHITVADTFSIEWEVGRLVEELEKLSSQLKPASAVASHDEYFGPNQQISVTILNMNEELISLHNNVVAMLKSGGARFNDPQYTGSGFRAHATVQPHARAAIGQTVAVNNLALIDMFPNDDPYKRKILARIELAS